MGNTSSLREPTAEELEQWDMQMDELYNPDPSKDQNEIRAEFLQKLNLLQREEFLQE